MTNRKHDRGAAAVEFALLLTLGIIAFGHAFYVQTMLDNAARDAVRIYSLQSDGDPAADARARAIDSASPAVAVTAGQIDIVPAGCPIGDTATVTITVDDFELLGGWWDITLAGPGSMRCTG